MQTQWRLVCRYMWIQTMNPATQLDYDFDPLDPTKVCSQSLHHCTLLSRRADLELKVIQATIRQYHANC